jgi:hypothetical protein
MAKKDNHSKTKNQTEINMDDLIRAKALELFRKRGNAHGNDWSDWFEAEKQVKQELQSVR